MNDWRKRFAEKMDVVRDAAKARFEDFATGTLAPAFDEFAAFTAEHGIKTANPIAQGEVRTYRFSITENAYVLLTFRSAGVDRCEMLAEFSVPHRQKLPTIKRAVDILEADATWTRNAFEEALDRFADLAATAFSGQANAERIPVLA